jgi:hypothetical protein
MPVAATVVKQMGLLAFATSGYMPAKGLCPALAYGMQRAQLPTIGTQPVQVSMFQFKHICHLVSGRHYFL